MARSFNGSTDGVAASAANPIGYSAITFAAWFNVFSTNPGVAYNVFAYGSTNAWGMGIQTDGTNTIKSQVNFRDNGGGLRGTTGSNVILPNVWYQCTAGYTLGVGGAAYLNGVADGTCDGAVTTFFSTTGGISISNAASTGLSALIGRIADVAIWNVQLTAAEALALSRGARPYTIRPTTLKAYWPLGGI